MAIDSLRDFEIIYEAFRGCRIIVRFKAAVQVKVHTSTMW